jgi:predicted nucleic acid-binding protein
VALILDTGPLYASLDRDDADHQACRQLIEECVEPLVIPAPVLVEVDYWVQKRLNPGVFVALLDDILSGAYKIEDSCQRISAASASYAITLQMRT